MNFHHSVVPFNLIITAVAAQERIPFSSFSEVLIMGFSFELLREAGIRIPREIGAAISIVGALVLGEAAVKAGFVGNPIVIITALTAICSFINTAYLFGDSVILNLANRDSQNSWISFIVGWVAGLLLIYLYLNISALNNHQSLIGILKNCFGKYVGTAIGLSYIWYFLHMSALVNKNYSDFLSFTNYYDTPSYFIIAVILLIIFYALKKGLVVAARSSEFFVPLFILLSMIVSFTALQFYRIKYFFPLWQWQFVPMLQDSFTILTFPFGESIVFLMILFLT